ncbi:hypothetical protein KEJ45_04635 [Candidatus Bathyarchaeota archaeon]|nr:hypothetical protein [Candidatus Bathyarchaeota archaeon]
MNFIYVYVYIISIEKVEVVIVEIDESNDFELQILEEALNSDYKKVSVRLREGEYQYELSRTIAIFQLQLCFPNVKDLIKKMYGEEKISDIQLIRKIQTILKKMEKSGVVLILSKNKPWELQRYALSSFKFLDSDKNQILFATDEQIRQTKEKLKSILATQKKAKGHKSAIKMKLFVLALTIFLAYIAIVWNLLQSSVNPIIFVISLLIAALSSVVFGKILAESDKI